MLTLVLSNRDGIDRSAVIDAANLSALCEPHVMESWRVPDELRGRRDTRLYAEPLFCEATCGDLDLALLEAAPDWLARCPVDLTRRQISVESLAEARTGSFPVFDEVLRRQARRSERERLRGTRRLARRASGHDGGDL